MYQSECNVPDIPTTLLDFVGNGTDGETAADLHMGEPLSLNQRNVQIEKTLTQEPPPVNRTANSKTKTMRRPA